jgi:hypothetical protein
LLCYPAQMVSYTPAGWPPEVYPPGSDDFELTAVAWLLDVLPPGYRDEKRAQRYPVGLAVAARHHTAACLEGARQGYRTIRAEVGESLSPGEVDEVLAVYRVVGARLSAAAQSVTLVERALRGEVFVPKL